LDSSERLSHLDQCFVDFYEAARARVVERQKQEALIVVQDDGLRYAALVRINSLVGQSELSHDFSPPTGQQAKAR
jgi:tetraacyldisaccharide-1-P 4'-kinase